MPVQKLAGAGVGVSFGGTVGVELAELSARLPSLQAELAAAADLALSLQASVSVDPTVMIRAALAFAPQAAASLALAGPSLSASLGAGLDAQLAAVAKLQADLGDLTAKIGLLKAKLDAMAGVNVYLYTGDVSQLGQEVGARVTADMPSGLVVAPVIVAGTAESIAVVPSVLGLV